MLSSPVRRHRSVLKRLCGLLSVLVVTTATASAQPGTIVGSVVDQQDGSGLPFTNVVILDTQWGAVSGDDGTFKIANVPPGVYVLKATYIGYEEKRVQAVQVRAGEETRVDFPMKPSVYATLKEVTVTDERAQKIDLKSTQVKHGVSTDDIASLPIEEITDAIALKPGVTARGGELFFRGGRSGEVAVMVDGVAVRNPLTGGSVQLSQFAVEDAEVILGGMEAKYGNAQSGVINYQTKEGGDHIAGEFRYETDDFGAPDKTFNNYDRVQFGLGGPLPVQNMNYYVSAQGTWSDAYPATRERRNHTRVFDFISVGERRVNDVRLQGKLTYKPGIPYKLALEYINNRTTRDNYVHNWTWEGFTKTFLDTLDTGEVLVRRGDPSSFKRDDTYEYYNAAAHTPNVETRFNQVKLAFTHTLGEGNTFYTLKASRQSFADRQAVLGKNPWEYTGEEENDLYFDYVNNEQSLFFVRAGDYPAWSRRDTKVYTSKGDLTHRWKNHTFETGFEMKYNDLAYHQVTRPYLNRDQGQQIGQWDRYHYYQPEGSLYAQDRWEHEGMVLNIGLRYDAFSVGEQIDPAEVDERLKRQISPRIGIAYPISDRDVFSFNYGRFYQFPDRENLYNNRNAFDNRIRGNPNLDNELSVSYQAAIQHLFSETVKGQFSVYFKDIFGLLSTQEVSTTNSANLVAQYLNRDYASSRGFEVSLVRSFAGGFLGEMSYTFGVASGVASDPDAQNEQSFRYLPISEQPLDWDQRHSFSTSFTLVDPSGNWTLGAVWSIGSGFPYTPIERNTRDIEPEVVNSRRLPSSSSLNLQAEKNYRVWGQPFRVFVRADNVLDARNVAVLDPFNWPLAPGLDLDDYTIYYTETGNAGGAYKGEDIDGDGREDWVPLNDPRVFDEGRSIRMGLSMSF